MKLAADDVQSLVIPGCGYWVAEQAPEELLAALTAFLAPCRDGPAAAHNPGPHAAGDEPWSGIRQMGLEEKLPSRILLTTVEKVAEYAQELGVA